MKTHESSNPYPECEKCKTLADCPHPEVAQDLMGSPMPPEVCLKPIDVMRETLKTRKHGVSRNIPEDN
jgi:hypothetical protein